MLPKYFKGRTLGSFVRQLNMYSFHKVKGQKHRHVFRHPFFKRGDEDSLRNIRRKHVGKELRQRVAQQSDKEMHPWNKLMADKLVKLREVLDIMCKQNQDLVGINNRMVNELQHLKHSWQSRSHELIALTANFVNNPNSRLSEGLKAFMTSLGLINGPRPLLSSEDVLAHLNAQQGDQFKNELNIFLVTEQLTSFYKQRIHKPQCIEPYKADFKHTNQLCQDGSFTGDSTNNNSSYIQNTSDHLCGDRLCNSVDDISRFDPTEDNFAMDGVSDLFGRNATADSEFESFLLDAFDSLSSDEGHLFMA